MNRLFEMAAEKGHTGAMVNLGINYYNGTGIAKNTYRAKEWIRKAVAAGDSYAREILNKMN